MEAQTSMAKMRKMLKTALPGDGAPWDVEVQA